MKNVNKTVVIAAILCTMLLTSCGTVSDSQPVNDRETTEEAEHLDSSQKEKTYTVGYVTFTVPENCTELKKDDTAQSFSIDGNSDNRIGVICQDITDIMKMGTGEATITSKEDVAESYALVYDSDDVISEGWSKTDDFEYFDASFTAEAEEGKGNKYVREVVIPIGNLQAFAHLMVASFNKEDLSMMDNLIETVVIAAPAITDEDESSSEASQKDAVPESAASDADAGQIQALRKAKEYLAFTAFSAESLADQLEYEGFEQSDVDYAVENCGADWYEQAAKKAEEYLSFTSFSKDSLKEQLEYEGFTEEQADYGVEQSYGDSAGQAVEKAKDYIASIAFSREGLIEQLEYEGFSEEESKEAVDSLNIDWKEQAALKAQDYLDMMSFSRSSLIEQLEYEGFSPEEAAYGADQAGL